MNTEQVKQVVNNNIENGKEKYDGLTSAEIGTYNRWLMFGDNDEGFDVDDFEAFTR